MSTIKNSQSTRPAYWSRVIEHTLRARMRAELAELGLRRSTWQILHTLADGSATAEDIAATIPSAREGKGRRGEGYRGPRFGHGRPEHPGPEHPGPEHHGPEHHRDHHHPRHWAHGADQHCSQHAEDGDRKARQVNDVLHAFAERGWVTLHDGVAELTDEGRAAHDVASSHVTTLRASATEGVSDADYATTLATLEAMARNLGWRGTTPGDGDTTA